MNIYTGLLFLRGHILRADDLAASTPAAAQPTRPEADAPAVAPAQAATAAA